MTCGKNPVLNDPQYRSTGVFKDVWIPVQPRNTPFLRQDPTVDPLANPQGMLIIKHLYSYTYDA